MIPATGIGDRLGRQVFRFQYDAVGNLESVCDAGDRCVTYSYIERIKLGQIYFSAHFVGDRPEK